MSESEILDLPCAQPLFDSNSSVDFVEKEETTYSSEGIGVQKECETPPEVTVNTSTASPSRNIEQIISQGPPAELLSMILQAIQKNEESRLQSEKKNEEIRLQSEKKGQERLDKLREDPIKNTEQLSKQFRSEMDRLSEQVFYKDER
jgi:hypothetical protein